MLCQGPQLFFNVKTLFIIMAVRIDLMNIIKAKETTNNSNIIYIFI